MDTLNNTQKKRLKSLAHSLKPVVMVGQHGLKETTQEDIVTALNFHQLIKIKVSVGDRDARDEVISKILDDSQAELILQIGNIAVMYKRNNKKENILKSAL